MTISVTIPQITNIPDRLNDDAETFATNAVLALQQQASQANAINTFRAQANALAESVNQDAVEASNNATIAETYGGLTDYKGLWVAGAYGLGESVSYEGAFYINNLVGNTNNPVGGGWSLVRIADFKPTVNSISELLTASNLFSVNVLNYHADVEGGGGAFYWDETGDKADHNGGTVIDPDATFPSDWSDTAQQTTWFTAGTGAGVWRRQFDDDVNVKWFGAKGDGVTNDRKSLQMAFDYSKSGKTLDFGTGIFELGDLASNEAWALYIDNPVGLSVKGNKAELITKTATYKRSTIAIRNPNDVRVEGLVFRNRDFAIEDTIGGGELRIGTYGLYLFADTDYSEQNPCKNVYIDCDAYDQIGLVTVSSEPTVMGGTNVIFYGIENVEINGHCERVYYGVTSIYSAKNLAVNMTTINARRGFISYGQKNAKLHYSLKCTENFVGSNAFIELATEGENSNQEYDASVENIEVVVKVSGVEAHEGIVTFYHINAGNNQEGKIENVTSRVYADNLTTVGKSPALTGYPMFLYRFFTVDLDGVVVSPTLRQVNNIDIDCKITGNISGGSYKADAIYSTKGDAIIGNNVFKFRQGQTTLLWNLFNVVKGQEKFIFTPIVFGTTTSGDATYISSLGEAIVSDGVCHFSIRLQWENHTGAGQLRIDGLPITCRTDSVASTVTLAATNSSNFVADYLFGSTQPGLKRIVPYSVTGGSLSIPNIPSSGYIYMSGSYLV